MLWFKLRNKIAKTKQLNLPNLAIDHLFRIGSYAGANESEKKLV